VAEAADAGAVAAARVVDDGVAAGVAAVAAKAIDAPAKHAVPSIEQNTLEWFMQVPEVAGRKYRPRSTAGL
jgi:hypothetical protein